MNYTAENLYNFINKLKPNEINLLESPIDRTTQIQLIALGLIEKHTIKGDPKEYTTLTNKGVQAHSCSDLQTFVEFLLQDFLKLAYKHMYHEN